MPQLIVHSLGGEVKEAEAGGEYGRMPVSVVRDSTLFSTETADSQVCLLCGRCCVWWVVRGADEGEWGGAACLSGTSLACRNLVPPYADPPVCRLPCPPACPQLVWMSHGDEAVQPPAGFSVVARSEQGAMVAIENPERRIFGLQYHPEVVHRCARALPGGCCRAVWLLLQVGFWRQGFGAAAAPRPPACPALPCSDRGAETIRHFLFDIAQLTGDWKMEDVLQEEMDKIAAQVGG